jgi:hypothetical protein
MELYEWELSFGPIAEGPCDSVPQAEMYIFTSDELAGLTVCRQRFAAGLYGDDA